MSRGPGRTFLYRFAVVLVAVGCCWCLLFFVMVVGVAVVGGVVVGAACWCCGWPGVVALVVPIVHCIASALCF